MTWGHFKGDMGHGNFGEGGKQYFFNLTCDIVIPLQGPQFFMTCIVHETHKPMSIQVYL